MKFKTNFEKEFVCMDIRKNKYPDRYSSLFDLVSCFEVIEHFGFIHLNYVLNEIYTVLKPGGKLLLSTPNNDGIHYPKNHVYEYKEDELEGHLSKYFEIEKKIGTFASQREILPVLSECEAKLFKELRPWFDSGVLSILFASLHPSQSRNILWVCRKV